MTTDTFRTLVAPTYIENWPPALAALSIPQVIVPLSLSDTAELGRQIWGYEHWFPCQSGHSLEAIKTALAQALGQFPAGAFVRLGSRSAKDSLAASERGLRVTTPDEAVAMLTTASQRVAFDLHLALKQRYTPTIVVRNWVEIAAWAEFRCFVRAGRLIGVSQYDCLNMGKQVEITDNAALIVGVIRAFFDRFRKAAHLDTVVFDVFLNTTSTSAISPADVVLLELNPFFSKTNPCLFNWTDETDFDGSFRFLT